jgi:hypothetical protein
MTRTPPYFGAHRNQAERERAELDASGQWEDWEVTKAEAYESGDGGFFEADHVGTGYPPGLERAPQIGDTIRVYGGFGQETRGAAFHDGDELRTLWFRTKSVIEVDRAEWLLEHETAQHERFEEGAGKLDDLYEGLPAPLKRRIDRFRAEDPDFRVTGEAYEMAACAEAGRLYRRAFDPEWGKALKAAGVKGPKPGLSKPSYEWTEEDGTLDWEDTPENRLVAFDAINSKLNGYNYKLMHQLMPEMDDGHSGNTWGHAFVFARALVRDGDAANL